MESLIEILKSYQDVCSVPFNTSAVRSFVKKTVKSGLTLTESPYSLIYSQSEFHKDRRKIIFMCHTDHPGITLKADNTGIFWGTPGYERLKKILENSTIPLKIYNKDGIYVGGGKLIRIEDPIKQIVKIESALQIENNFSAQYDLDYFSQDTENIYAYNLDNGVSVALMIEAINNFEPNPEVDVIFCFNLHEEVYQISAWHNAKYNVFKINTKDLIINLECLKVENVDSAKYPTASYEGGVVIQLSNTGCLFGHRNKGDNLAEQLSSYISSKLQIKSQLGVIKDSCDSRPFTQFALTPNICSLTVPNEHKHNNRNGSVEPEQVKSTDLHAAYNLIQAIAKVSETDLAEAQKIPSLCGEIKSADDVTNKSLMRFKRILNERLEIAYIPALKRGYYYPETFMDRLLDLFYRLGSYAVWLNSKLQAIFW